MKLNILIGGKAGQGINKISSIVSNILGKQGYFTFNYRDYPSLIRGGHNFNVLSISDKRVGSIESKLDIIIALDEKTAELHRKELKKDGIIIGCNEFCDIGRNANIAQAGALIKILGFAKEILISEITKQFGKENKEALDAAERGYKSKELKYNLKRLNNKITIMTGSYAVAEGAINSGINLYMSYPMTPATNVMTELALREKENGYMVFQPENEIAVANAGLGASFCGAKTMIGSAGGGYDLMTEALSFQGVSEIPLVVYLASRPGPGTGIPTYSTQADLDVALYGGHGEFPRVVIAPGDPIEAIEKTNEAFYLSQKYGVLSIIMSDKHLAESEFSSDRKPNKPIPVKVSHKIPGEKNEVIKANSYEHDESGNTTEIPEIAKKETDRRMKKDLEIAKELKTGKIGEKNFEMIKIFGKKDSKNLIIGWGSTKTAILDAIEGLDYKFLQVIYIRPLSDEIESEIKGAKKVILIENNATGQLAELISRKTGFQIKTKILKYDGKPFYSDELKEEIQKIK